MDGGIGCARTETDRKRNLTDKIATSKHPRSSPTLSTPHRQEKRVPLRELVNYEACMTLKNLLRLFAISSDFYPSIPAPVLEVHNVFDPLKVIFSILFAFNTARILSAASLTT